MAGPASPSSSSSQERNMFLKGIKLLLGLVFVGYLVVWVLAPTNLWKNNWLPNIRSKTDSRYFGQQGANILLYTFPILFIAALGGVYLHLGKKAGTSSQSDKKKDHLSAWRRPVLTRGPLGVVSALELAFLAMFMALLVWSMSKYLTISFNNINKGIVFHHHGHTPLAKKWQRKLRSVGFYLGIMGNICCAFLFYPVTRGSSILPLLGLTSEGSVKYHIWLGHMTMFFFTAHGIIFVLYWAITNTMAEMLKWANTGVSNVAGEIALLLGLVMWLTVLPRIRRKMFELFFYVHQLYALFMFFYVLHLGMTFFCTILPGFYLFLIDRYLRFLQSRQRVRLVSARVLPCQTLELNFSKSLGLNHTPTSVVFINVPSISSMQWHPFTVSSNSNLEPDKLSVIIKREGSWTQKLYEMLSSESPVEHLNVSIEGPYGPATTHFLRHEAIVMVSGGSGITPFISIIRELIFIKSTTGGRIPRVTLICAFKHSEDLAMLDLLLPVSGSPTDISCIELELEAFVTREREHPGGEKQPMRILWFKPDPSDASLSPVLGPNGWLWLGTIVATSFILFLTIIGIIGQAYIYPIDHNTNEVYSYSSRAVLNVLFICVFIIGASSVAFLWVKKQNTMEMKQVQSMEVETTTATSPSSWFYNTDRELESFPQESLAKSSNVHFGSRPNLKKMLLEQEGTNVGVLVSGPTEMRHEVASICSSGVADNLYFEAISFNW